MAEPARFVGLRVLRSEVADFTFQEFNSPVVPHEFRGKSMINDLIELEPLLSQYDPDRIIVGPLRNLSISSSFRYFYIAGSGSKVYESIGLGFEAEPKAESQRLDIIEKVKSRFREVTTPGSPPQMT